MAFNLVDTIFIGQLGTTHLAAVSFTFPVIMVVTNLAIGLGIGTSSAVARAVGEHDLTKIQNLSIGALILSLVVVGACLILGLLTVDPLFRLIGANEEQLVLIKDYINVWYGGMIFLVVPMVGNYIIRATGDMLWPGIIMIISSLLNLILDPILIFGMFGFPRMEIKGAAVATVIAWIFTFFASSCILYFREKFITLRLPRFSTLVDAWKSIAHVAFPAAGTHMIVPIGAGIIMSMVALFGEEAVAAFGAASRVEMFAFIIFLAMSAITGPFVGQNMGAGRFDRILHGLRLSYRFCLYFGLFEALLLA
ncbi:MAG: MATE family efflux transporter, partial [Candidatus Omnitrophica bacterium]|nr:MATE family efflux transporter [Candidatus Omnitrophota bacterium]